MKRIHILNSKGATPCFVTSSSLPWLNLDMVDVAATLLLAIRAITPAAENKNIRLEKSFARQAPRVYGDATRLQQIFWNLLSNAVKFTPAEGSIRIRLFSTDSQVEVEVSDNGKGIGRRVPPPGV